jgi:hypothetical protein
MDFLGGCTPLSGRKVPTVPQGNRFPRECTLLTGTEEINHLASGCGINAEKSLLRSLALTHFS